MHSQREGACMLVRYIFEANDVTIHSRDRISLLLRLLLRLLLSSLGPTACSLARDVSCCVPCARCL